MKNNLLHPNELNGLSISYKDVLPFFFRTHNGRTPKIEAKTEEWKKIKLIRELWRKIISRGKFDEQPDCYRQVFRAKVNNAIAYLRKKMYAKGFMVGAYKDPDLLQTTFLRAAHVRDVRCVVLLEAMEQYKAHFDSGLRAGMQMLKKHAKANSKALSIIDRIIKKTEYDE